MLPVPTSVPWTQIENIATCWETEMEMSVFHVEIPHQSL